LGETVPERLEIRLDGRLLIGANVSELKQEYEQALEVALGKEPMAVGAD